MTTALSGTTFKTDNAISDNLGRVWTISTDGNGYVLLNGQRAGGSYNAAMLLWYANTLYHQNTSGAFYAWNDAQKTWFASADPRTYPLPKMFYGINAHWDFPFNPTGLKNVMLDIGLTSIRMTYESSDQSLNSILNWLQALRGSGITFVVCINCSFKDSTGAYWQSEDAAYNYAKSTAAHVAQTLTPYGDFIYEMGNEYTRAPEIISNPALMGTSITDFKQGFWPQMRGLIRGIHDGVKSIDSKNVTAALFCVADIGASDALWNGNEPGGATGKPQVRWDLTSWHNYEVYGDIFNIARDGDGTSRFNLVDYCDKAYGVPFIITEWGGLPEQSDADQAAYYTKFLTEVYSNRSRGNGIKSVMLYQMLGSWGITNDSYTLNFNARYGALKSFVKSNVD
jgi:hypothetical protein